MHPEWPQSLLNPEVYPHPVDALSLIETHISWVILTGTYVYKIKKPVALGFLDFSTLEKRHYFCDRELQLNRRFSRDIYLDVVTINGDPSRPVIGADGEVIDYAVRMRQFDNDGLAEHLAQRHQLSRDHVRQIAQTLAGFHQRADSADTEQSAAALSNLKAAAMQNFAQIREYPLSARTDALLTADQQWLTDVLARCQPLMTHRQQQGMVRDCHGDCHLGNMVLIDGRVTLFDCIEFNDAFRIMDTFAEAAFLDMDLCARELPDLAQVFLNAYLEYSGDYDGLALLNLYRSYYALVRAKVSLLKMPASETDAAVVSANSDFHHYMSLSQSFRARNGTPALILMHGLSGAGKSFLAEQLVARSTAIRIRSDVERKRLFGLQPEQSGVGVAELYTAPASKQTFARLLELAQSIIAAGFDCIVDATFLSADSRRPFIEWAQSRAVPVHIVHCFAEEALILERLRRRTEEGGDASDADIAVYRRQQASVESFTEREQPFVIDVDTGQPDFIDRSLAALALSPLIDRTAVNQ